MSSLAAASGSAGKFDPWKEKFRAEIPNMNKPDGGGEDQIRERGGRLTKEFYLGGFYGRSSLSNQVQTGCDQVRLSQGLR